jgi:hypothetical protein
MDSQDVEVVQNQIIHLDGQFLTDKKFVDCKIVYSGGTPPVLRNNDFVHCQFEFEGAALNTLNFLRGFALGARTDGAIEFLLYGLLGLPAGIEFPPHPEAGQK